MNEIQETKGAIAKLTAKIEPLKEQRYELEYKLRTDESKEFILVNSITKDDVEVSEYDETNRYFGHVKKFAGWLSLNSTKRFAEWNGQLHFQSDLKGGYFKPTAGRLEDVK